MTAGAKLIFHGVRGSSPSSGVDFVEYGGDTPAIECQIAEGRIFLDAGSGLGNVRANPDFPDDFDLVLSHYHYDHLVGLPFFEPLWRISGRMRLFAPKFGDAEPADILAAFFASPFCPVRLSDFRTRIEVVSYRPGDMWRSATGLHISSLPVSHPGGCAAIRIGGAGIDAVYASDAELGVDADITALANFARSAALFIVDAMNGDEDADKRRGWGHASWREAIATGTAAEAQSIALFHHDPKRTDIDLVRLGARARALAPNVFVARQGAAFRFKPCEDRGEISSWRCSR